jgi:cobalt-precorrin-5B (C1)-methyltransferase
LSYNILIFGGTTEGLKVAQLLDALREPYIYSTKTQTQQVVRGEVITGALTADGLTDLIQIHSIKLIIDAAHPFAEFLHQMIITVGTQKGLISIRYQRTFLTLQDPCIHTFSSYKAMQEQLIADNYETILALTGVQTIPKLKKLWTRTILFRILATNRSLDFAKQTGIPLQRIHQEEPSDSVVNILSLAKGISAQVILSKESGTSGYFESKVAAAKKLGIPLYVVTRPPFSGYTHEVNSKVELHQLILRLRKTCLKGEELRSGYTTGSCLTAAAQGAFTAIMKQEIRHQEEVQIACGEHVNFLIYEQDRSYNQASYVAIKDGGDDPDVTHAQEIGCTIRLTETTGIQFKQGVGVGRVTLPGLQIAVGEPAINPVPRQVINLMLENLASQYDYSGGIELCAFVPRGKEIAQKTFNPRVGVVDGISIIGTTGKVLPYSSEAFIAAIAKQLAVANENKCDILLATSGLRSENKISPLLASTNYTAVHFGNFVGETLQLCHQHHFPHLVVGIMLAKAIKLAEGRLDTHSKHATFNKDFTLELLKQTAYSDEVLQACEKIQLANELTSIIPFSMEDPFYVRVAELCHHYCRDELPDETQLTLYLLSANHENTIKIVG